MKKRLSALFLGTCIFFASFSCSNTQATSKQEQTKIDNSDTNVSMIVQEYEGDNIVEIPMISYDGQQPALAEYEGKNPEIEMINNDIKANVLQKYNDFAETSGEDWLEIKTYPFTNDRMIQLVITYAVFPAYGTDGDIMSYNFDKENNEWVSIDAALSWFDIPRSFVEDEAKKLFSGNENEQVNKVEIAGFRYIDNDTVEFLLKLFIDNPDADPWDGFFSYIYRRSSYQDFNKIDPREPFPTGQLDTMKPSLSYGRQK